MPKHKALYTDFPWSDPDIERAALAEADCELVLSPDNKEETLIAQAAELNPVLIVTCWAPTTARVIDAAPNCRHIARTGIGLDNIDVEHATGKGILVTNVPDYCVREVAEHALAMVMDLGRKLSVCHHATKSGVYDLVAAQPIYRLKGQTLGIIGLGATGTILAELAQAIGMQVIGTNRSQQVPPGVTWKPLDELLAESDYVSLNCPLSDETHQLMNAETFAQMKPTAYLINTARGGIVDHEALAAALDKGQLAGAALDVQTPEPPDLSRPPYNDPRVIVTPHSAFCSPQAITELRERVGRQAREFLLGRTPECVVNPEVLDA
ncbi:putative 2-hydroxyacid dehydrogenase [Posidoniimonas corsicana]|uniref:Putative 2-hydroxyacid dehydrogenase n=1 Tax=Posidoniimonas corsicana TaxID=1938618 RepID=A0A5C5V1H0_9BACT|nr:C-terminal binding protein [Posidoniimonas corsicana]TWT32454.1 putative 2-hydroxyacid dehydrogenase [Posidoniimonas corsicana]